jgi:electron transfer flavoprotein alpha/beta subunit
LVKADDLSIPEEALGLKGSFTQVVKVFPPPAKKDCRVMGNLEPEEAAKEILVFLKEKKLIQ